MPHKGKPPSPRSARYLVPPSDRRRIAPVAIVLTAAIASAVFLAFVALDSTRAPQQTTVSPDTAVDHGTDAPTPNDPAGFDPWTPDGR